MASSARRLVFRGVLQVEESLLPPIPPGHVLVRVVAAGWTGVEQGVARSIIWLEHGRVVGHTGFGFVVKRGARSSIPEGSLVVQDSVTPSGLHPGLHIDGWLAEYTALPESSLKVLDRSACDGREAFCALLYPMGIGVAAVEEARGSLTVIGCGVSGLAAALYAKSLGIRAELYCVNDTGLEWARRLGLEARLADGVESVETDTIYLSSIDPHAVTIVERSSHILTLLHPIYSYWPPPRTRSGEVRIVGLAWIERVLKEREVLEKLAALAGEASLEALPGLHDKPAYYVRLSTQ